MIKFKKTKNKRIYNLSCTKADGHILNVDLNFLQSSLINRFDFVIDIFTYMCKKSSTFNDWFYDLLNEYIESNYNSEIILSSIDSFIDYGNEYLDILNIDYSKFVDLKKASKTSIFFDEKDIKAMLLTSTCLKLYAIFQYDQTLKIPENVNKIIYDKFSHDIKRLGTTDKIFQLIKSRTYRSSITDRFIWDLVKITTLETPDTTIMSVFNFFMTNLLSLLDATQNPIFFLVKIVDDNIRWLLCEIYKQKIVYDEAFSGDQEIITSKEAFHIYCCNDVIAKAAKYGLEIIQTQYGLSDIEFDYVRDRLDSIKFTDSVMRLFNIPIISNVLEIPYKLLLTSPPKHIVLMSTLIFHESQDIFNNKYPILSNFLISYPEDSNSVIVRSSYKLRNTDQVMESDTPLFGINSRNLKFELLSPIIGILSISKKNLSSILTGEKISKITYSDLEEDCIKFYTNLYSNKLTDTFNQIRERVDKYFL